MLLTKEVEVKLWGRHIKYYHDLGYKGKHGDIITVKVDDLPSNSRAEVEVECDYCHKPYHTQYSSYLNSLKYINKSSCNKIDCKNKKTKETNQIRYGVDNTSKLYENQEKWKNTNIERYGTPYYVSTEQCHKRLEEVLMEKYGVNIPCKSQEILDKVHKTNIERYGVATPMESEKLKKRYEQNCLDKYGVKNPSQLDIVKEKKKQTCLERYGVASPSQAKEIREKYKKTCLVKYGVDNTLKNPTILKKRNDTMIEKYGVAIPLKNSEILEKMIKTLYAHGGTTTSAQQIYLHSLYGGKLNYPIKYYSADICFPEEKLDIEYDGGGHNYAVKLGNMTQEEFNQKEVARNIVIKREGYKQMRIISFTDKLPSDEILLQMLEQTRQYFSDYPEHSWIEFSIDSSSIRNAENKDRVYYDYGQLHKIKKEEIQSEDCA